MTIPAMENQAIYFNGVFENVLDEVVKAQTSTPGLVCYLQPYSSSVINLLAKSPPSIESPMRTYISLSSSLAYVSYRAKIIGWEKKQDISATRLVELNKHIEEYQPGEGSIYLTVDDKPAANLISVIEMEKLVKPIHVSNFKKISDGTPLKPRSRSGNWSYVFPLPEWSGTIPQEILLEVIEKELEQAVKKSSQSSVSELESRLQRAVKIPEPVQITTRGFRRNPDVIAFVMKRAKGKCEHCRKNAPFNRASDGTPYLEVHHKIMLSQGGEDTVENALALCPNCHREVHFGVTTH